MIPIAVVGITAAQASRLAVEPQMRTILAPLGDGVRRVRVAFTDDNGPKGGVAVRCAIDVRVARWPEIHVEASAVSARRALDEALEKLAARAGRTREAVRDKRRYPKKYFVATRALRS